MSVTTAYAKKRIDKAHGAVAYVRKIDVQRAVWVLYRVARDDQLNA